MKDFLHNVLMFFTMFLLLFGFIGGVAFSVAWPFIFLEGLIPDWILIVITGISFLLWMSVLLASLETERY